MNSFNPSRRPKEDEDDEGGPVAPPQRGQLSRRTEEIPPIDKCANASFAQHYDHAQQGKLQAVRPKVSASVAKGSGRVTLAMMAKCYGKSSVRNGLDTEVEGSAKDTGIDVDDSRSAQTAEAAVGAIAVPGISAQTTPSIVTYNSDMHQDSFINRSPPSDEQGQPSMPNQNEPIIARRVEDDEADIEAQVQSRVNKLIPNAVVAEPLPNVQKSKRIIIVVAVLAIIAVIGAAVGVAVSNTSESSTGASSQAERCSFCYDGSTSPPNLETNKVDVLNQTCSEYRQDTIQLASSDSTCVQRQAVAAFQCECPSYPPRPENVTCKYCDDGASPSGPGCNDTVTLIHHLVASSLFTCKDLLEFAYENGCACPAD